MSAIVSMNHVDVVVGGLVRHGLVTADERDAAGAALHAENVAAVNSRYSTARVPGAYAYTEHARVSDAVVARAATTLDHVSSESPTYTESRASELLSELMARLASHIESRSAEFRAAPHVIEDGFVRYVYDAAPEGREVAVTTLVTDPAPWRHVDGERAAAPDAPGAPPGGYTYSPRRGYSDHEDRYVSTRNPVTLAVLE